MTTWADIQRLAADLQRVQFADAAKKLSEGNCIEVVSKLIGRGLIDVVFTRDGKTYVTNKHLETEVKNEVEAAGGRIAFTDIAQALNIDYDHIDRTAKLIAKEEEGFVVSNGELFAQEYVAKLRRELEKLLIKDGSRTKEFLCKYWDLSQDLLKALVLDSFTGSEGWTLDGDTIYTEAYLQRHNNILSAVLLPLTKPTPMSFVIQQVGLPPQRFWTSFDELLKKGEIAGRLLGSKTSPACSFVPKRFDDAVKKFAVTNFKEKEFLELSTLRKLGFSEAKKSIQEVLEISEIELLPTIAVANSLLEQFKNIIKDAISSGNGICDVQKVLQSSDVGVPLEIEDIDEICQLVVKSEKSLSSASGFLFSSSLLTQAIEELKEPIENKSQQEADRLEKEKKQKGSAQTKNTKVVEEDDDWGDSKGGKGKGKKGGKASQPKGGKAKSPESDEKTGGFVGIDSTVLEDWLKESSTIPGELVETVAEKIHAEVNTKIRTRVADLLATMVTGDAQNEKKKLAAFQAKARTLYDSICSLEASTSKFSGSLQTDLTANIIKTLGVEFAATVISHASGVEDVEKMTEKQKEEIISTLAPGPKDAIGELQEAIKATDFEKLHDAVERVSQRTGCGLDLRAPSDKAMSAWTENYVSELSTTAKNQSDPAAVLLSVVLLLLAKNGKPTAASGKFVQRLVQELGESVPKNLHELLVSCQQGVVTCIKNKSDDVAKEMLASDIQKLKAEVLPN